MRRLFDITMEKVKRAFVVIIRTLSDSFTITIAIAYCERHIQQIPLGTAMILFAIYVAVRSILAIANE